MQIQESDRTVRAPACTYHHGEHLQIPFDPFCTYLFWNVPALLCNAQFTGISRRIPFEENHCHIEENKHMKQDSEVKDRMDGPWQKRKTTDQVRKKMYCQVLVYFAYAIFPTFSRTRNKDKLGRNKNCKHHAHWYRCRLRW